jgi:selenocysteine-specific elongation factor
MDIIAGTAGHIDHGKTALVKALTGIDADRLPEEKQRGITIDLGFAELDLGEVRVGFVDVPGHERFVKNMLAGTGGIDLVMLVVAADEGVMPQTREHFEICRLLEVKTGLMILTKCDLVDAELLGLVRDEVTELVDGSFLDGAPALAVSAKTGEGIDEVKKALVEASRDIPARQNETVARLPIDRSFTVKGFGAVVTGTLLDGEIAEGDELELLPQGRQVRVRGLQTHKKVVKSVRAGQRAAVNLAGIDHSEIERGMVLCEKGVLRPTQIIDTEVEVLKDAKKALRSRQRVRVHTGTVEALARVEVLNESGEIPQGETDFVQLRLEIPVVAIPGDRFIIRSYSPQATIAGGRVIDGLARKHPRRDTETVRQFLQELTGPDKAFRVKLFLEDAGESGLTFAELQARTGWRREILLAAIASGIEKKSIIKAEEHYLGRTPFDTLRTNTLGAIEAHHAREPLTKGILRETLREKIFRHLSLDVFKAVLTSLGNEGKIAQESDVVRLASHSLELAGEEKVVYERLGKIYWEARFEVPRLDDALTDSIVGTKFPKEHARKIFQVLLNSGQVVKVTEEFYFTRAVIDQLTGKIKAFAGTSADRLIDVPKFKEIAGISRKYAIPLLEYFDREKVTRRAGDKRLVL